jgi:hypothetical protein
MIDDYTTVFNQARKRQGKPPVTGHAIILVREGTVLACGCKVHNASKSHFSVYHGPECQRDIRPRTGKEIVGIPLAQNGQAVATLAGDLIGVTNPWLGLWPHEVEEQSR